MFDDFELIICDEDFGTLDIDFLEIELNPPISDEDIRYAKLEELIFRDKKHDFSKKPDIPVYYNPGTSWNSSVL